MMTEHTRVTFRLSPKSTAALEWLTGFWECTQTDSLNKALQLARDLKEAELDGAKIAIIKDGVAEIIRIY